MAQGEAAAKRLQVAADGTYEFIEWTQPDDMACFLALLTLYQWKARRK